MKKRRKNIIKGILALMILGVLALSVNHFYSIWVVGEEKVFVTQGEILQYGLGYLMSPDDTGWQEGAWGYFIIEESDTCSETVTAITELGMFDKSAMTGADRHFMESINLNDGSVPSGQLSTLKNYAQVHNYMSTFESKYNFGVDISAPTTPKDYVVVVWRCDVAHHNCLITPISRNCVSKTTKCDVTTQYITVIRGCNTCTDPELCLLNYVKESKKQDFLQLVHDMDSSICREEYTACMKTQECEQLGVEKSLNFRNDGTYVNKKIVHCEKKDITDTILKFVNENSKSGVAVFGECKLGVPQTANDCEIAYGESSKFYIVITPTGGSRYQSLGAWAVKDDKCVIGECVDSDNCKLLYGSQGWICRQTYFDIGSTGLCDRECNNHIECANRVNVKEAKFIYGCFNNKCMRADESGENLGIEGRYICDAYEQRSDSPYGVLKDGYAWYIGNDGKCYQQKLYEDQCQKDEDCTKNCVAGEKATCFYSEVHKANLCTPCVEIQPDPTDHCSDGILNFDEEGVDCGGKDCEACGEDEEEDEEDEEEDDDWDILPAGVNIWIILGIVSIITGIGLLVRSSRR